MSIDGQAEVVVKLGEGSGALPYLCCQCCLFMVKSSSSGARRMLWRLSTAAPLFLPAREWRKAAARLEDSSRALPQSCCCFCLSMGEKKWRLHSPSPPYHRFCPPLGVANQEWGWVTLQSPRLRQHQQRMALKSLSRLCHIPPWWEWEWLAPWDLPNSKASAGINCNPLLNPLILGSMKLPQSANRPPDQSGYTLVKSWGGT